ncbi:MAG: putative Ig domain-containing protein, partial [Candidatus Acidiferrum sp.]
MLACKRHSTRLTLHLVCVALFTTMLGLAGCASTNVASGDSPAPGKITVTTSSLPTGQTGNTYTATLQVQGGTAPYKWSLTAGTLPAGLSLNSATGVISGTPTQSVTNLSLSFTVMDSSAKPQSTSVTLSLTVTAASSGIAITTQSLPNGQIGVAYSATLAASGGKSPFTWSLTGGTLPAGLILNGTTGAITGTPTAATSATALTFKVTDSSSPALTQTATLTVTIFPAGLVITTTSLPNGQVNASYSAALTAVGGTSPYTWSLTSGTLPAGLSLNGSTGAIIGTPTVAVTAAPLIFKVTDASSPALIQTVNLALTISPAALVITTTSLPNGQINTAYSATLAVSGGTGPYTWTQTSGTLPAGLTLNAASGALSGKPTAAVTNAPLTFKVTDSSVPALTQSANLTITISASPLVITTSSLPNGQQGAAYTATLAAVGGVTPYVWTITSGTLPTGLTLNGATGAITGTPTVAVTNLALTFKVTDSSTPALTQSANLTLTIGPAPLVITTTSLPNGQVGTAYS